MGFNSPSFRIDEPEICDFCAGMPVLEYTCQGPDAHCKDGRHCTYTMYSCSMEDSYDIHSPECCYCKEKLR